MKYPNHLSTLRFQAEWKLGAGTSAETSLMRLPTPMESYVEIQTDLPLMHSVMGLAHAIAHLTAEEVRPPQSVIDSLKGQPIETMVGASSRAKIFLRGKQRLSAISEAQAICLATGRPEEEVQARLQDNRISDLVADFGAIPREISGWSETALYMRCEGVGTPDLDIVGADVMWRGQALVPLLDLAPTPEIRASSGRDKPELLQIMEDLMTRANIPVYCVAQWETPWVPLYLFSILAQSYSQDEVMAEVGASDATSASPAAPSAASSPSASFDDLEVVYRARGSAAVH